MVRMVVEGDGSYTDGFVSVISPKHQAIVFDIDGTLTISDFEVIKDYLALSTAEPFYYAQEMLEAYREKGYELIFLTARPYWMTSLSRFWLKNTLQQSEWPLKTKESTFGTAQYKADYLKQLINDKKVSILRAYGNALTDIEAYSLAEIPKSQTFIIGPNAGKSGTQGVEKDYFTHYHNVVVNTPEAQCKASSSRE